MPAQTLGVYSSQSTNEAANQSTVSVTIVLYSNGWSFDGYSTSYGIRIGDAWYTGTGPRTLYSPNTWSIDASRTYNHTSTGYRDAVSTEAYFDGTGPYMPDYLSGGGGSYGAIDYTRIPSAPSYMTVTNVGPVITANWPDASTPFGPLTYYWGYRSSTNGGATWGAWSGDNNVGTAKTFTQTFTGGATYQFRARAANSDGTSGWTESNTVFLSSGGKRFTGTNWALTVGAAKRFNGTSWVDLVTGKRFDGTNWVNLT